MAEPLKNIYNKDFFDQFTKSLEEVMPDFDTTSFIHDIYDDAWKSKELKERMRHITLVLNNHLEEDFQKNTQTLLKLIPVLRKNGFKDDALEFIFLPDFIEVYGLEHFDTSIAAIEIITQFITCEFAVRPFIIQYPKKMMKQMRQWSKHSHPMVRRLSSEGCRPRLPWAMALPTLKQNPSPILPILKKLKKDESESVRRSVANNLNDISKDHPTIVIDLVKNWLGKSKEVDWVCKHASRTLLKQGNKEVMQLFGFGSVEQINITHFKVLTPSIKMGDYLEFSFQLENTNESATKIRLEYGIYFQKANGTLSRKVFKISEKEYPPQSKRMIEKRQHFKPITTRKYHSGQHQVSIIINGEEMDKRDFELVK